MSLPKIKNLEDRKAVAYCQVECAKSDIIFREQNIDYGIDALVELVLFNRVTGRMIGLQIKGGRSYFKETTTEHIIFRADEKHVNYWLGHSLPIIVVLVDTKSGVCYWQQVTKRTVCRVSEDGFKILVPKSQTLAKITPLFRIATGIDIERKGPRTKADKERLEKIFPLELAKKVYAPAKIIDDCLSMLKYKIEKLEVKIKKDYKSKSRLEVYGLETRLVQVYVNLINNALESFPIRKKGKSIRISIFPDGRFCKILISDNGMGISSSSIAKVFDPFFSTKPGQTGLGLPVSRRIIHEHKGSIQVESAVGKGTRVITAIPSYKDSKNFG